MLEFKINDLSFYGDASCSKYHTIENFRWYRGSDTVKDANLVFFTDLCLDMVNIPCYKDTINIAWIIEPASINKYPYEYIKKNNKKFNTILSHDRVFIDNIDNGSWYPNIMSWIDKKDIGKHNKSINISIIASDKNWTTGHKLRHEIINKYKNKLYVCGRGYTPVEHKISVLGPSRFSFAIENCNISNYWSEKILDCFLTHTVPIYYGTNSINEFFNDKGIVRFSSEDELSYLIDTINKDGENLYNSLLPYIEENYNKALELGFCSEDWIYKNILKERNLVC